MMADSFNTGETCAVIFVGILVLLKQSIKTMATSESNADDEQGSEEDMDDETDECEYSAETSNVYGLLSGGAESDWSRVQRSKRKQFSVDENTFQEMFTDDKLGVIFSKLIAIEQKQSEIEIVKHAVKPNERVIDSIRSTTVSHSNMLHLLNYKTLDLEARSGRKKKRSLKACVKIEMKTVLN